MTASLSTTPTASRSESPHAAGGRPSAFRLEPRFDAAGAAKGEPKLWVAVFDLPGEKVNKLSREVMEDFETVLPRLEKMHSAGEIDALVIVSGKPGNFVAGADIALIQSAKSAEEARQLSRAGQKMLDRWEDLPFPTIVAIHGAALGGGCELSLASSAIVMADDPVARTGLPEVMLGFVPGMGGCIRLPRKIGLAGALDLILTGRQMSAKSAVKAGLAEAMLPREDFERNVLAWVKRNLPALKAGDRLAKEPKLGGVGGPAGTLLEHTPMGRAFMLKKAREGVVSKTRGKYPAPLAAIELLRATGGSYGERLDGREREEAMEMEAETFGRCAVTPESKNLVRLFFMTEAVKKSKGVDREVGPVAAMTDAGVLGAGVMGGGIAQLFADKGVRTRMKDLNAQALQTGMQAASRLFERQRRKKKIDSRQMMQKMNLISPTLDYSGFRNLDLVVEAIIEKMDVKKSVLSELEKHVGDKTVIASNTSSLSVTEMQNALTRPERFAGMHFFNPVHRMPLVEVIRGARTNDEAVAEVFAWCKQIGKTPVVVKDAPGFLVNRLLAPYLNESTWLVSEGAPVPELDEALLDFGMPMGPMELIDEVGVDVGVKVEHILNEAFGERMKAAPGNEKVLAAGRLGKKNGKGIYEYGREGRDKKFNPEVYSILGVQPKSGVHSAEEMVDRCILPMINEAARCLEEGIVANAADVDLGMIMGTGFPPFRGGLLRYADSLGAAEIVSRLKKYEAKHGARFTPSAPLVRIAEAGLSFHGNGA